MSFLNHDLGSRTMTFLRFVWAAIWVGFGAWELVKAAKVACEESGLEAAIIVAMYLMYGVFSATIGVLPWIIHLSDWFGNWFVMGLLWTNEHERKAGDPLEPICRLIESGRHREAVLALEKLLDRHPDNHEARFILAEVFAVYLSKEETALQLLRDDLLPSGVPRKCRPAPENIPALLLYCDLAERFDLRDEAIRLLRQHCRMKYNDDGRKQLQTRLEALLKIENPD